MVNGTFYIIDVFAETRYAGNQLAVFIDRGNWSTTEMQSIAREMHFSETTFVSSEPQRNGGYAVRIFTPRAEVPFAGHPTLGTAFIVRHEILTSAVESVLLNEKVGPIPVTFHEDVIWMKQIPPTFGLILDGQTCAEALGITVEEIDWRFPIQVVSTGLPFVIVPVKRLDTIKRAKPNWERYVISVKETAPRSVLLFCPETYRPENQLNARVFVDEVGVPEDPATGSANGCLAGYLVKYGYGQSDRIDLRVEQGYEIARPSLLLLRAETSQDGGIDVRVGGKAILVARGELV